MKKQSRLFLLSCLLFLITGCTALLPSAKQTVKSPWATFDEAKTSYDKIIPKTTAVEDLKKLGFDPFSTPNAKILTYQDVIQRFMFNPTIKKEELDEGIQICIDAKTNCYAYEFKPRIIKTKRYGNFWLDFFNFKREIKETGWKFDAIIVIVNDIVVYKLWGGSPVVDEDRETKNPLGPLQDASDLIIEKTLSE